ncbi:hypothetical protein [uncultured Dokdonia sp.]|uniref:hypothetical protein n=1 Tax=uncultured Dokdonia sp. TaxID=575653 RepID=UPI00260492F6|nr:hypothetical protein [uncultured Dokdonia sp.]
MKEMEFEKLLGKSISFVENTIDRDFENKIFGNKVFYIKDNSISKFYFGMIYNHISLETNENDLVHSVTINFQGMLDRDFYDNFNVAYGKPQHIQIIENRQLENETFIRDENGNITQHLKKSTFDLREGTFEEQPLWIIWRKEGFEIKAFLRHKNNRSEITFKKL